MTAQKQIKIEEINHKSPHLPTVIELWGVNRATLGLLPKGAFEERAASRQILVALDPQAGCIGYLLYRCSYDRITIVHLCIAPSHRSQGVASLLVDYLKQITREKYSGIGLSCRRDYGLDNMWSRFNFVAKYDKPGNGKDKKQLTFWWFDHGHANLLSNAPIQKLESKLCVVIDAKVFRDLYAGEDIDSEESRSLLADWLAPELELCITDEIFNIINKITDDNERKNQREYAGIHFTPLPSRNQRLNTEILSLNKFFSHEETTIDESDVRHLARTIASDAQVFVTREQPLLKLADEFYENFRLSIIRPNALLSQLDELLRKPDYQPVRLAGTLLEQKPIQKGQEDFLSNYFQCSKQGETKAIFQQQLRRFLADTDKFECSLVIEGENQPLALVVYGRQKKHELEIPILRVSDNLVSATLASHLIFQAISRSSGEDRQFTRITDSYLEETVTTAIQEDNFVRVKNGGWLKANLAVTETASQLSLRLKTLGSTLGDEYNFCVQLADTLNTENLIKDVQASANIERFLFPAKIIDAEIPTFIVPIQPRWAMDLFDEGLANQTLFGAKRELAFNREAVYYRSAKNSKGLKVPCRILWYVSQDEHHNYYGVGAVRACSVVDEVVIGKPKELYQRFQRLGVYKLTDILNVTPDTNGNIMAIRFSNTELFNKNFIELKTLQKVLNNNLSPQSPYKINNKIFQTLYNLGIYNEADRANENAM